MFQGFLGAVFGGSLWAGSGMSRGCFGGSLWAVSGMSGGCFGGSLRPFLGGPCGLVEGSLGVVSGISGAHFGGSQGSGHCSLVSHHAAPSLPSEGCGTDSSCDQEMLFA